MKKKLLGPLGLAAALAMGLTSLVAVTGPAPAGATVPKPAVASVTAAAATDTPAAATTSPYLSGSTHYPFTFTQANGTKVTLKAPPTRMVVLGRSDEGEQLLLALGTTAIGGSAFPGSMYGATVPAGSFKNLGGGYDDDLEAIAAVHPDLILDYSGEPDQAQLTAIAPVFNISPAAPSNPTGIELLPGYSALKLLAQVLNRQSQANAFFAKEAAAIAKVKPLLQGITMDYLADFGGGTFDLYSRQFFDGSLFTLLGITIPTLPAGGVVSARPNISSQGALENFSDEQARVVTSQYILIQDYGTPAFQTLATAKELPAIKSGHYIDGGLDGFPADGVISNLDLIPKFASALLAAGTPPYRSVGTVGKSGSLSGVNLKGYDGPLYTKSGSTYAHIANPGVKLAPGTTIYGI